MTFLSTVRAFAAFLTTAAAATAAAVMVVYVVDRASMMAVTMVVMVMEVMVVESGMVHHKVWQVLIIQVYVVIAWSPSLALCQGIQVMYKHALR